MNIKNSNSLLNLSTAKFDLITKALKWFGCMEIRIENSTLILENTGKSVAYVQLDEFLDGNADVNFCVNIWILDISQARAGIIFSRCNIFSEEIGFC